MAVTIIIIKVLAKVIGTNDLSKTGDKLYDLTQKCYLSHLHEKY